MVGENFEICWPQMASIKLSSVVNGKYFGQNFLFLTLPSKMECLISSLYLTPQNYLKNINLACFCFDVYMNAFQNLRTVCGHFDIGHFE